MFEMLGFLASDETEKNAVNDFIKRYLIKNFEVDKDYYTIDKEHDLVKKYITEFCSAFLRSKNNDEKNVKRGGSNKKYYAVTGNCFKMLTMLAKSNKGIEVRKYYLKIENMAQIMILYCAELEKYIMQKQLDEQKRIADEQQQKLIEAEAIVKETLEKKERVITQMRSLITNTSIAVKDEYFYIAVTKHDAENNIFKIGKTDNLKNRLTTYNCGKVGDTRYYYAYFRKCYNATNIENMIRAELKKFKLNGTKDVFQIRFDFLERLCDAALDGQDNFTSILNELITVASSDVYCGTKIIPEEKKLDPEQREEKDDIIVITSLSKYELKNLAKSIIDICVHAKDEALKTFSFDKDKDMDYKINGKLYYITVKWSAIRKAIDDKKIKYDYITPFKNIFKEVVKDAKTLMIKWSDR